MVWEERSWIRKKHLPKAWPSCRKPAGGWRWIGIDGKPSGYGFWSAVVFAVIVVVMVVF